MDNTYTLPSYREALQLLDKYANMERSGDPADLKQVGSARMGRLMQRLGSPHASIPAVHVAGTKGKGSTTHMVAAALTAAGIRTGLYTSPHVETLRERIVINGRPIGELRLVEALVTVLREADAMTEDGDKPSYFEVLTAAAFVTFKEARVEAMVLETGLGGRLDATNLPDLRCIAVGLTSISKDHESVLGDTLEQIADEKLAIIRAGVPVVTMPQEPGILQRIKRRAADGHSPLFVVGKDIGVGVRKQATPDKPGLGQRLDLETWRNVYPDVPLAMLGAHQASNAGLAVGLVDLFLEYMDREPLDSLALRRAWRGLLLPARMEVMGTEPWHIIDGAHNPASAWAAAEAVQQAFSTGERTLVFGVAKDKNYRTMLRILLPLFKNAVFTAFESDRAVDAAELAEFASGEFPNLKTAVALDSTHAVELARELTSPEGLILTTGSLYLAGEVRGLCRRQTIAKA